MVELADKYKGSMQSPSHLRLHAPDLPTAESLHWFLTRKSNAV